MATTARIAKKRKGTLDMVLTDALIDMKRATSVSHRWLLSENHNAANFA